MRKVLILAMGAAMLAAACSADDISDLDGDDSGVTTAPDAIDSPDSTLIVPEVGIFGDGAVVNGDVGPFPGEDAMVPFDAGDVMCRAAADCFRQLGRPPLCPDGTPGNWACVRNQCGLDCPTPVACDTDCDCPFSESCIQNTCRVANRPNFCCLNPDCPPGAVCVLPDGRRSQCQPGRPDVGPFDIGFLPDGGPGPDAGPAPVVPIGAMCGSAADCNGGLCIDPASGFPGGYCTDPCGQGGACPTGATCVGFGPQQDFCLDECVVNADCRTGYQCVTVGTSTATVCFPTPPSSNNPNGDPVGSACVSDNDCRLGLSCIDQGWPGGYCTRLFCDTSNNPCPAGSSCYPFPGQSLCLQDCRVGANPSDCRPRYSCFGPAGGTGGCLP